ncbi:bestrophin family ion channel [Microvirga zambiensis]|uniref:bestrophin family ion channel n=1 Tax=Microvirga zambiensis TaxID=1402137 RepID=UPI00191E37BC|nr:bestrophin family ion channel [Microvirga zambiensis]
MHVGRQYKVNDFLAWTRWEIGWIIAWSLLVTLFLAVTGWSFLTVPGPILTIVGSALAISLAFKSQQCYARFNDGLILSGQVSTASLVLANRLMVTIGNRDGGPEPGLREIFYRHFAWLTALRFYLREKRAWENTFDRGNVSYLARLPSPESKSVLDDELNSYLSDAELKKFKAYRGDKEALLIQWQYDAIKDLHSRSLISELIFTVLASALDELLRLQGGLKRVKNYPYSRNYYSIAVIVVKIFVAIIPFGLFPYSRELGEPAGIAAWTAWLNVPLSAIVGWIFVAMEKVGENSSNPFEGNANDVPISSIARRIEIEMRTMLGEQTDLRPIEAKGSILF